MATPKMRAMLRTRAAQESRTVPLLLGDAPPGPPVIPTDVRCAECADVFATSATIIHHRGRGDVPVCCPCAHDAGEHCQESS